MSRHGAILAAGCDSLRQTRFTLDMTATDILEPIRAGADAGSALRAVSLLWPCAPLARPESAPLGSRLITGTDRSPCSLILMRDHPLRTPPLECLDRALEEGCRGSQAEAGYLDLAVCTVSQGAAVPIVHQ